MDVPEDVEEYLADAARVVLTHKDQLDELVALAVADDPLPSWLADGNEAE
jgi:hypothetical protein